MRVSKISSIALFTVLACGTLAPRAGASERDKKTIVTFSDPVEIPGQVLLPGTYVFKLFDSPANRNIAQIWNEDEDRLLAMIQTIADYKPQADDKSVFYLEPVSGDSTAALKSWFYPGETWDEDSSIPITRQPNPYDRTRLAESNIKE
jgi:hypothetical protein